MYGLTTTVPPAEEPVTPAAAADQCRTDLGDDEYILTRLVKAARELTERHCGRRWVTQTLRLTLGGFPTGGRAWYADDRAGWGGAGHYAPPRPGLPPGAVVLPVGPVQSVSAVAYYDTAGTLQTMDTADWQAGVDLDPPVVCPAPLACWPMTQVGRLGAVRIDYVAGYGLAAVVPELAKQAILLAVGYWFANRGDDSEPSAAPGLPPAAVRLLDLLDTGAYP